jgi:FAD:protein FMN transferase
MTRRAEAVMGGMPFTVETVADAQPALLDAVFGEIRSIDRTFSPFAPDSAVSRINDGTLLESAAGPLVVEVLALCRVFECMTDGYFSAWYAGRLDPCGLVKGWAVRRAARMLEAAGHRSFYVDGAGDVTARGERGPDAPWRVGIRHPVERDRAVAVVAARDLAVATSGTYERGAHIRDPHTRRAATELLSLTVVGPDIVAADVYATAAFAMGRDALAFIASVPGYQALAIDGALFAASTPGFEALTASAA